MKYSGILDRDLRAEPGYRSFQAEAYKIARYSTQNFGVRIFSGTQSGFCSLPAPKPLIWLTSEHFFDQVLDQWQFESVALECHDHQQ